MYLLALILVGGFFIVFFVSGFPRGSLLMSAKVRILEMLLGAIMIFGVLFLVHMGTKMESLDNAVVEMYLENNEIPDIADSADITVIEVIRILRENGFEVKR